MYAVIFTAKIKQLDDEYVQTASRMRQLALSEYGCTDFQASCEKGLEIAISYWPSLEHIKAWHNNAEHKKAQKLGREKWYEYYKVDVTEIIR